MQREHFLLRTQTFFVETKEMENSENGNEEVEEQAETGVPELVIWTMVLDEEGNLYVPL